MRNAKALAQEEGLDSQFPHTDISINSCDDLEKISPSGASKGAGRARMKGSEERGVGLKKGKSSQGSRATAPAKFVPSQIPRVIAGGSPIPRVIANARSGEDEALKDLARDKHEARQAWIQVFCFCCVMSSILWHEKYKRRTHVDFCIVLCRKCGAGVRKI